MIDPVEPDLQALIALGMRDRMGGCLTLHCSDGLVGLAVTDADSVRGTSVVYVLDREDRAALIRVLTELQGREGLR